jgi:serine/threonine-protein kinase
MTPDNTLPPPAEPGRSEESLAAAFLRAWQQGDEPGLDAFASRPSHVSSRDLVELIRIDLDANWARGRSPRAEAYLQQFAQVANDAELALDVIYAEFLARELSGDHPEVAEYQRRFPEYASILEEQIGFHSALKLFERTTQIEEVQPEAEATYEILEQIGSGGMGVVYKARQAALNRLVALKMMRAIDASNPELLQRFRAEAQFVASLRHPHIVQVYDCGEHEGLPYLTMELVEGGTLADRLGGATWPPRVAAELLATLAEAVQFAHDRHVIHRDLKPANVLIAADGRPPQVKITDFGLAKLLVEEPSQHTRSQTLMGTPSYMAPEQARGRTREIGPAADVYSLGAILYELLTGRPPFLGENAADTLRMVLNDDATSVHQVAPHAPRDLATICDKCLEREPHRRYRSAGDLQADLQRFLQGKPIVARKASSAERAWRWCRRNPVLSSAFGSVVALLVSIAAMSLMFSAQIGRELANTSKAEGEARAASLAAQRRLWDAYLAEAVAKNGSHKIGQRYGALDTIDLAATLMNTLGKTEERQSQLRDGVLASVALTDLRVDPRLRPAVHPGARCAMSVSADRYFTCDPGGLSSYELSTGKKLWTNVQVAEQSAPQLTDDGKYLALSDPQGASVWAVEDEGLRKLWEATGAQYFTLCPDGTFAAYTDSQQKVRLVRGADGSLVHTLGSQGSIARGAFHPSQPQIAVQFAERIYIFSTESGDLVAELPAEEYPSPLLAWHPDGVHLAAWSYAEGIVLWNVPRRSKAITFQHVGLPSLLAFNRHGTLLVSHSMWNDRLLVWDVGTGQRLLETPAYNLLACAVKKDGELRLLTNQGNGLVVADLTPGRSRTLAQSLARPLGYILRVSVSPNGRLVALSSDFGWELWDVQTTRRLYASPRDMCRAEFSDIGDLWIACTQGVFLLPKKLDSQSEPAAPGSPARIQFGPPQRQSGRLSPALFFMNASGNVRLELDAAYNRHIVRRESGDSRQLAAMEPDFRMGDVSDDGRFVGIARWHTNGARVWSCETAQPVADLQLGPHGVLSFSPDSKLLAATPDGVTIWRTADWQKISELHAEGIAPTGLSMAFSPDSRMIAVGQVNGVLGLFDPYSGKQWGKLAQFDFGCASALGFSLDQSVLVTTFDERSPARVWDLWGMRDELQARGLDWPTDVLDPAGGHGSSYVAKRIVVVVDDQGIFPAQSASP